MRNINEYEVIFRPRESEYVLRLGDEDVARFKWDIDAWKFLAVMVQEGHVSLDEFSEGYIECILWTATSSDEEGNSLDLDVTGHDLADFDAKDLAEILMDCRNFSEAHGDLFDGEESQAGHDFCLTRNGHGAGYWDGDWSEPGATTLTDASHAYGTQGVMAWQAPGEEKVQIQVHN